MNSSQSDRPAVEPAESLVARVRKLLDKAERTDNEHESEAFARKAAELVAHYRIQPEQLADAGARDDLGIVELNIGRGAYVRGRLALLMAVAAAHDVRVVFRALPGGTVAYAAGHRRDLDVVEVMYTSLHQQASGQMAMIKRSTGAATQRFRRSFLFGFATRLGDLLAEARSSVEASAGSAEHVAANALALQERAEKVDEFVRSSWGRVRAAGAPRSVQPDGFASGVSAAERADVGRTRLGGRPALGSGPT
ncbi:MAG: DUF2786 domain-containing protein [Ilumatobacter sp.]|jgi:hypothetical protein|uniref:DUF2786 domain-containing protein n=1 Tax=Ilumatobacter sp. TaxID=1967498 RepID=UPI00391E03F5